MYITEQRKNSRHDDLEMVSGYSHANLNNFQSRQNGNIASSMRLTMRNNYVLLVDVSATSLRRLSPSRVSMARVRHLRFVLLRRAAEPGGVRSKTKPRMKDRI